MTSDDRRFRDLPPRVDPAVTVVDVPPYEAVEEIRGVRRVSPYSPLAEIDEARLFSTIGTDDRAQPWRRRAARATALFLLAAVVLPLGYAQLAQWLL